MNWFAIQTLPAAEQKAKISIERMGFNVICPVAVERRMRLRSGLLKKEETYHPMFPGYIFLEAEFVPQWMRKDAHILRPLPSWDEAQAIPASLILSMISRSGEITVNEWARIQGFAKGDTIRRKGDRSGLTMTVLEVHDKNLTVLVEMLGKLHRKVLPQRQVEAAE